MPGGVIESEPLPKQTPASPGRQVRAISTQLKGAPPTRRNIRWLWLCVAAVPLLALLGVVIYVVTDNGTVKITGADASMVVRVDNKMIRIENIGEPISLHFPGPHDLLVTRGELVVRTQTFHIKAAGSWRNLLEVSYIPKPPATEPGDRKKQDLPSSGLTRRNEIVICDEQGAASPKASPAQTSREWTNTIGMKLVRIDAGEFLMGTSQEQVDQMLRLFPDSRQEVFDHEQPQHLVKISRPFFLGMYEVTHGQYQAVMHKNPSRFKGSDLPIDDGSGSTRSDSVTS